MNGSRADLQNLLHEDLASFVAGGTVNPAGAAGGRWLPLLMPRLARRRLAPALVHRYRELRQQPPVPTGSPLTIPVAPYSGRNAHVHRLMAALAPLEPWLAGAYAHGSSGTGEEVPYSDLDALVILGDRAFESAATLARVASRLSSLQRIMYDFDPLQHHGWFVLTAADLDGYCDAYFPAELFRHARSLLPVNGGVVTLRPRESGREIREAFTTLAAGTLRELDSGRMPADAYRLKGTLSRILLLPCLYLQARSGVGVFKKSSFAAAARDFPPATWAPMDEISALRSAWIFEPTAGQRLLLTRPVAARRLITRNLPTTVPEAVRRRLTPELWRGVAQLIRAMQAAVGN